MLTKPALVILFLAIPVFGQNNPAPPAKSTAPPEKASALPAKSVPKPIMAAWTEAAESFVGISKDQFSSMGFSKLTNDEYAVLLGWIAERDKKVEGDAKATAVSQTLTYSCGRTVTQADEYDKVNLYLDISNDAPSELASRIRQNFRAMKDVQVVFSTKEADLKISILGFEVKTAIGNNPTGYAASATVTEPCTSKVGTYESGFSMYQQNYLQTSGTNAGALAEGITTSIDADVIESQRKTNALYKQLMPKK